MRTLCTIDTIRNIRPIPNADSIEVGSVRGWDVVVRKGEFSDGETVLYIEPDAALPVDNPVFSFLKQRGTIEVDGRDFHVLRTARLRGQVSQGLVLPATAIPEAVAAHQLGESLDKALEVFLYEKPIKVPTGGYAIGPWPFSWLKKTDSERVQNIPDWWFEKESNDGMDYDWYASEKIDGMSTTYVRDGNKLRICSRNLELRSDDPDMLQLRVANDINLIDVMRDHKLTAVQGEVFGEGIQSNRLAIKGQRLRLFDAWRYDEGHVTNMFYALHMSELLRNVSVPFFPLARIPRSAAEAIEMVDGMKSSINPDKQAEGLVWHHDYGRTFDQLGNRSTFKAINPAYLIKHKL